MMPIGPLMIEHRLIERMIAIMGGQLKRVEKPKAAGNALAEHFQS